MNSHLGLAPFAIDHFDWFHVRIKLVPLTGPVSPDLFFPNDTTAFRCLGPAHFLTHERQGAVDIPIVEGRVRPSYQCLYIRHKSSCAHYVYYAHRCMVHLSGGTWGMSGKESYTAHIRASLP